MRVDPAEYLALPLEAHGLPRALPLRDVSAVDLPRGGRGRTLADVRALLGADDLLRADSATAALVRLRLAIGGVFGWDEPAPGASLVALVPRGDGYRLLWAVHVRNASRLTPLHMAVIEPFRRFVVYPSMPASIRTGWRRRHGTPDAPAGDPDDAA